MFPLSHLHNTFYISFCVSTPGDAFCDSSDRDLTSPIRDHDKPVRHEVMLYCNIQKPNYVLSFLSKFDSLYSL